jgi:hypothetical protein
VASHRTRDVIATRMCYAGSLEVGRGDRRRLRNVSASLPLSARKRFTPMIKLEFMGSEISHSAQATMRRQA